MHQRKFLPCVATACFAAPWHANVQVAGKVYEMIR